MQSQAEMSWPSNADETVFGSNNTVGPYLSRALES